MKAIVANVLFGGILGCLNWTNPVYAAPIKQRPSTDIPHNSTFSARLLQQALPNQPRIFSLIDNILTVKLNTINPSLSDRNNQVFSLGKKPYTYQAEQTNLILGFQNTFWPSTNKHKYWGVTTVEHWGKNTQPKQGSSINYAISAPSLAAGSSALTFSGGGNNHLESKMNLDQDAENSLNFEQFRGGITYHHGVVDHLTMGVGLVYDDLLVGFTQLTYDSDILPVKTTLSLLTKESETALHSHVRFQPAQNFVLDYRSEGGKHQFDLDWGVASDFALIAKGNSKQNSYSTGIKFAVRNDFMTLSATAVLNNNRNLEWKLSSQIGGFKFSHSSNKQKSNFGLDSSSIDSGIGFQCSAFVKYQTRQAKKEQEEFIVWGAKIQSTTKMQNTPGWEINLGFGSGHYGEGLIANGSIALKTDLVLNLDYQEISALSDETKIKLQLSSK